MISISTAVGFAFYVIIGALIFGLLYWAVGAVGKQCGEGSEPFVRIGRVVLLVLAVFVCIGLLLSLVNGTPVFRP